MQGALYHTTENLQWTNVISDPNPTVELDDSGKSFSQNIIHFSFIFELFDCFDLKNDKIFIIF